MRLFARQMLFEHLLGIDGDEDPFTAGENFAFGVLDFSGVEMAASANADFVGFDTQWFMKRHRFEIVHRDLRSQRDDVAQAVHFAHGVVEDGGDDAAVTVAGRADVAVVQAKLANVSGFVFVDGELQLHAIGIVFSAGKTEILLQFYVVRIAGRSWRFLAGHVEDCSLIL